MIEANTMAMLRLALQVVAVVLLLSAVLGSAARPLDGDGAWVVVDALRRLYLPQLGGPGASCGTNSPNNGCPP